VTESFETIGEPKAKTESEARSFCEISENERNAKFEVSEQNFLRYSKKGNTLWYSRKAD